MSGATGLGPAGAHRLGLALGAGGYLCWGLLSPGNKILLDAMGPLWMQAQRTVLATLMVAVVLRGRHWRDVARLVRRPGVLFTLGLGNAVSFTFFTLSQTRLPATFTTLGFYTSPVWTALLARAWIGERPGHAFLPTVAGLLFGGWLALGSPGPGGVDAVGLILAVGSGLSWAAYSVRLRGLDDAPFLPVLWLSMALGAAWFLLLGVLFEPMPAWAALSGHTWTWVGIQVAVPTLASLGLFQAALRHAPASGVNLFVGLELAGTALFSVLLLGDRFSLLQVTGLVLVLASITAYMARKRTMKVAPAGA